MNEFYILIKKQVLFCLFEFISLTHTLSHTHTLSLSLSHTQGSFPSDLPEDSLRFSLLLPL